MDCASEGHQVQDDMIGDDSDNTNPDPKSDNDTNETHNTIHRTLSVTTYKGKFLSLQKRANLIILNIVTVRRQVIRSKSSKTKIASSHGMYNRK